jgi:hypothetical protein
MKRYPLPVCLNCESVERVVKKAEIREAEIREAEIREAAWQ